MLLYPVIELSFANSFFVRTAIENNDLPQEIVSIDDNDLLFSHFHGVFSRPLYNNVRKAI